MEEPPAEEPPAEEPPAEEPPPPPMEIKNPDSFIMATIGGPDSLDPSYQYDKASYEIIFNVYEGLLFYNRDKVDEFVPVLATGMPTMNEDGSQYVFELRQGIKFHEGGDLTPSDVAYSFWRTMIQDRAGGPSWVVLEPLTGYYAIDDIAADMGDEGACEFVKSSVVPDDEKTGRVPFRRRANPRCPGIVGEQGGVRNAVDMRRHCYRRLGPRFFAGGTSRIISTSHV